MAGERPAYGLRLMPSVLDDLAKSSPNKLFASIPKTSDVTQGFRDITAADFARCVNFTATWLENKFGCSDDFETIAYVGIGDLRGAVIFLAAVKCGYKVSHLGLVDPLTILFTYFRCCSHPLGTLQQRHSP